MLGTVENTHHKFIEKTKLISKAISDLNLLLQNYEPVEQLENHTRDFISRVKNQELAEIEKELSKYQSDYNLSVVSVLSDYYRGDDEHTHTTNYYRIITSNNFITVAENIIGKLEKIIALFYSKCTKETKYKLGDVQKTLICAGSIKIPAGIEKYDYEICECGTRMTIIPEWSELHCDNPQCGRIKTIIGTVFRDDQFYPQEGQKTKHGSYDTSRHYKFWMERLQALETKTFSQKDLNNIERIISRDRIDKRKLNCETMRGILKDPQVSATYLNEHTPLLVKTFGGPTPPRLDFHENRLVAIKFNKTMKLYDIVNPTGGNKPYYPYFIYKIIEYTFKDDPEKLKILNFIHLQSRETVIKNDKFYEEITKISNPQDGLVYKPTQPN